LRANRWVDGGSLLLVREPGRDSDRKRIFEDGMADDIPCSRHAACRIRMEGGESEVTRRKFLKIATTTIALPGRRARRCLVAQATGVQHGY
jgi:hypothetical protein